MITIIKNVLTGKELATYSNDLSTEGNLTSYILLHEQNKASQLHNPIERDKARLLIETIKSKAGHTFAYSQDYDLTAIIIN